MRLYIVSEYVAYEMEYVLGVFSTLEKAGKFVHSKTTKPIEKVNNSLLRANSKEMGDCFYIKAASLDTPIPEED